MYRKLIEVSRRMKKRVDLDKLEESLEIIIFIAIVVSQLASSFIPAIENFLNDDITTALTSVLLIAIYMRIIKIGKISKIKSLSFPDALTAVFERKTKYKHVKIFAYSAKNYIAEIKRNGIQVQNLYLLLKQASDTQAWFSNDSKKIRKYKAELSEAIDAAQLLVTEGLVKNLVIKYYDFESYSHFGVFDNFLVSGLLIPQIKENMTVTISEVQVMGDSVDYGSGAVMIDANVTFFDTVFEAASENSGLDIAD